MKKNINKVWITWEDHRRSKVLASEFGCEYKVFCCDRRRYLRYPVLSVKTLVYLFKVKPKIVFCQNPSIILTFILCIFKPIFSYRLICDRHTNFKFMHARSMRLKWVIFRAMSGLTLRVCDLTIVTNSFLKEFVECCGGRSVVLQDKIPCFSDNIKTIKFNKKNTALFVCTFSEDEPFDSVISAAKEINHEFCVYVTGNYKKSFPEGVSDSDNVKFLGFVSEDDYLSYMKSVDVVIILTSMDYTLNCGAYEAVAMRRPMILSNSDTIKNYFNKGAIYTDLDKISIKSAINDFINSGYIINNEITQLKSLLEANWNKQFEIVLKEAQC